MAIIRYLIPRCYVRQCTTLCGWQTEPLPDRLKLFDIAVNPPALWVTQYRDLLTLPPNDNDGQTRVFE